ncbi:hypothetical protein HWV62_13259 [Athelia sp. TMB]|nr:hypothetical protein HWV62_13259 [Athelia sp. TMB]
MQERQPALMSAPEATVYRGNCHCGAFVFRIALPALDAAPPQAYSICRKKGYLTAQVPAPRRRGGDGVMASTVARMCVVLTADLVGAVLRDVRRGAGDRVPRPRVGDLLVQCASPFPHPARADAAQTRLLQDVDFRKWVPRMRPDQSAATPYPTPTYSGLAALTAELQPGEKIYPGSCHCGAVTFALRTPPLDNPAVEVKECDCSLCLRLGPILTYPSPLTRAPYHKRTPGALGPKMISYQFCSTCGVCVFLAVHGPPDAVVATLPPARQALVKAKREIRPVNVRALDFFLGREEGEREERGRVEARVERTRGSAEGAAYVVPGPEGE